MILFQPTVLVGVRSNEIAVCFEVTSVQKIYSATIARVSRGAGGRVGPSRAPSCSPRNATCRISPNKSPRVFYSRVARQLRAIATTVRRSSLK